jgi:hypothetical protein
MLFQVSLFYYCMIRKLDFNFRFKAVGTVLEKLITVGIVNFHSNLITYFVFQKLMSCCVAFLWLI